jgi:hypothetical protein
MRSLRCAARVSSPPAAQPDARRSLCLCHDAGVPLPLRFRNFARPAGHREARGRWTHRAHQRSGSRRRRAVVRVEKGAGSGGRRRRARGGCGLGSAITLGHNNPSRHPSSRSITLYHIESSAFFELRRDSWVWHDGVGFRGDRGPFRPHSPTPATQLPTPAETSLWTPRLARLGGSRGLSCPA